MNTDITTPQTIRKEFMAFAKRVPNEEIIRYESHHGKGTFEQRGDVVSDTLGEKIYCIITYDESQKGGFHSQNRVNIVRVKVSLVISKTSTDPLNGKYPEVLEELPWED